MTIKKLKSIDIINVLSDLVSEKLETTVKLPRVTTPAMAKDMTSSYIVVGRTITKAADPVAAYKEVFNQFQGE